MSQNDLLVRAFAHSVANDSFELILLPTEQCNFRCVYCYEDFSVGRMQPDVVRAVKRLIARRIEDVERLTIMWFGGEPLVAVDIVEDISAFVSDLAAARPQVHYSADMTTNGYRLDVATLSRLSALGVHSFQISLDGPRSMHDTTRRQVNGRGSFDQIWSNLLAIRSCSVDVSIMLRIHVTPQNLDSMDSFVAEIRDLFLIDPRFSVLFMPVAHLGGPNDATFDVLSPDATRGVLKRLTAIARGDSRTVPVEVLSDTPGALSELDVCYASKANSLMIRANGSVGKCTVALRDPANNIGRLLPDGTLDIQNGLLRKWLRGWETGSLNDLACPRDAFFLSEEAPRTDIIPLTVTPPQTMTAPCR